MATINATEELAIWSARLGQMTANDVKVLTEDQYNWVPEGKSRSARDIAEEVVHTNLRMIAAIEGDSTEIEAPTLSTKAEAAAALVESAKKLAEAIRAPDVDMTRIVNAPWGEELSLYQLAQLGVNHILYHDGQLNYIHRMLGDDQIHWFS